ncbi:uncharacterized protein HD556DRAFT_1345244 [Suillus plorans]|uniref:Uncharacterized protein n=1 Tax=Suillus plorans TaxID=116603 RepID=A0A9P7AGL4_9AGAM|nr:uncharacterized protein HD556DRAFT_1404053 [Suillus plorans]XP_041164058.1 uncharacterized protein HD556DRAFT_1345244 [Suillus plorans]KAG1788343.1 hypothetical protein HD556DRAFT_1404053 [Suillus plorans]KAG1799835.1 hypothetical protein HD556DRAFT_1345244 [Suillus plorans]
MVPSSGRSWWSFPFLMVPSSGHSWWSFPFLSLWLLPCWPFLVVPCWPWSLLSFISPLSFPVFFLSCSYICSI